MYNDFLILIPLKFSYFNIVLIIERKYVLCFKNSTELSYSNQEGVPSLGEFMYNELWPIFNFLGGRQL